MWLELSLPTRSHRQISGLRSQICYLQKGCSEQGLEVKSPTPGSFEICFPFETKVSLCSLGWLETDYVDQASLRLRHLPTPASLVLKLKVCTFNYLYLLAFILYVLVFCLPVCLCTTCMHDARGGQKRASNSLGLGCGITNVCKLPFGPWELTPGSLEEQPVRLSAKPTLQNSPLCLFSLTDTQANIELLIFLPTKPWDCATLCHHRKSLAG